MPIPPEVVTDGDKQTSGLMERSLHSIGSAIGRYPKLFFAVGFISLLGCGLGGWLQLDHPNDALTDMDFKLLWTNSEGRQKKEIEEFLHFHGHELKDPPGLAKPWYKPYHYTMIVNKDRGQDVMTPEVMEEIWQLYLKFFKVNVTTKSGLTYTTADLCDRGALPDVPGNPIFPCMISDPFQCFSEYLEALDPSFQGLDPIISNISVLAANYPRSFTSRPSWRKMNAREIKEAISQPSPITGEKGCSAWTQLATWSWQYWGGGVKWNADETVIEHQSGVAWSMYYDGYARAAFRMSFTQPDKAIPEEVEEAIELHKLAWGQTVFDFNQKEAKLTECSNLRPGFIDDVESRSEEIPWGLLIAGILIMNVFVFLSNFRTGDHRFSRAQLAGNGLFCVLMTTLGGSGLLLLMGFKYNASMIAALPLLTLGLGLDDAFVLIRYFMTFSHEKLASTAPHEIIGQVLEEAGPGVFLTSFVNAISFGMGAMLPIPGLATFCVGASIASALNLFTILTLFLPYMCLEINRVNEARRECPCQQLVDPEQAPPYVEGWEDKFVSWLETSAAPAVMKPGCRFVTMFIFFAFFGGMFASVLLLKSPGYTPKQIAPHGTNEYLGLEHLFEFFGIFPAWLVFKDVDVPNKQGEMLQLYDDVTSTHYGQKHPIPPYLSMFYLFNPHLLDNSTYSHPTLAPNGIATKGGPETFYPTFNLWRHFPVENATAAFDMTPWGMPSVYTFADLAMCNEFTYQPAPPELGYSTIKFSFFPFFITNLKTDQDFIDMIKSIREVTDNNPLGLVHAYPYSDMLTFWSVFLEIEPIMWRALGLNMCVLFVLTTVFLKSPLVGLASVIVCIMIVIEIYGLMMLIVQYNMFVATSLIACSGLAIEDVAHFVAAFKLTKGSTEHRIATAMKHTYVAIILGSISTFLALIPLVFHYMDFVILYQCVMFLCLVVLGCVNGTVFLPTVLATFGTCTEKKEHAVSPNK